jgi:hypothetical protein
MVFGNGGVFFSVDAGDATLNRPRTRRYPMSPEDRLYFERRAEAEIEAARRAQHAAVVQAHYQLATHYLDRIYGEGEAAPAAG